VTMDLWDSSAIDMIEPGFIEFGPDGTGEFGFIAVRGWLDCRWEGRFRAEFSWQGYDDADDACGRGWVNLRDDSTIDGHIFVHLGDDSAFRAVPFTAVPPVGGPRR
jgi:hypothetical protein